MIDIDPQLILISLGLIGSYFLIVTLMQVLLQALSYRSYQRSRSQSITDLPTLTLLIPARNEAKVVVEALKRALQLPLKDFQVIVIENASTDQTYTLLHEEFQLKPNGKPNTFYSESHPHLRVIRSAIPGKALALNLALPEVKTDLVATLDADTIPDSNGLIRLLNEFAARPQIEALGGIVRVMDPHSPLQNQKRPPKGWPLAFQSLEYLRAFSGERLGWGLLKANVYMSGACALFRTESLKARGGFQLDTVTEDLETSLELVAKTSGFDHPIDVLPVVVAWTQVPGNLRDLFKQRRRWQAGLCQCLWKYRGLFLNTKKGMTGIVTLPYMLLTESIAPLIEFLALATLSHALYFELIDYQPVILIAAFGLVMSAALTTWTAALENKYLKDQANWSIVKVFILSFPLNICYRPLVNLVRIEATLRFRWFYSWGSIKRVQLQSDELLAK
ncbi:MAG: glycosyltransferase family 2 protein [Bacteriovoracaceae bacterium]|nr:glycosyltransferase family 2 protein [Bacteriovoracaceae bacterium]